MSFHVQLADAAARAGQNRHADAAVVSYLGQGKVKLRRHLWRERVQLARPVHRYAGDMAGTHKFDELGAIRGHKVWIRIGE